MQEKVIEKYLQTPKELRQNIYKRWMKRTENSRATFYYKMSRRKFKVLEIESLDMIIDTETEKSKG